MSNNKGWYTYEGKDSDVVVSSRVRLARNFDKIPFTHRANPASAMQVIEIAKKAIEEYNSTHKDSPMTFVNIAEISDLDKMYLVETHSVSPALTVQKISCGFAATEGDKVSVMINEEDHLRIQSILPGLAFEEAYKNCLEFEGLESLKKNYAYSREFGYLTSCPTNTGTAIRVSAMLHLPALVMTKNINRVLDSCGKLGIAVRGVYGENSNSFAHMYQISNQVTLGRTEDELIKMMNNIVAQICAMERDYRKKLKLNNPVFTDKICRAYGTLCGAWILPSQEALENLSLIKLGLEMGILKSEQEIHILSMIINIQPASLQKITGKVLSAEQRDTVRAQMMRDKIGNSIKICAE